MMVKDAALNTMTQVNTTQKRQISHYIQDMDNLTKRILTLDSKNAQQRKDLIVLHTKEDQLTEKLSLQRVQCDEHQEKIDGLTDKLDDAQYEKNTAYSKARKLTGVTT